jgi:hypothetical protein
MKTYEGGCHCGAVSYEVDLELDSGIECNCSHCEKKGFLLAFAPAEHFTLKSGEENLTDYQFNRHIVHHLFCKTCGVQSFGRGEKNGQKTVAINVRCLKDVDLNALKRTPVDGRSK